MRIVSHDFHVVGSGLRFEVKSHHHDTLSIRRLLHLARPKQYRGRSPRIDATMVKNGPAYRRLSSRRSSLDVVPPVNDIRERH